MDFNFNSQNDFSIVKLKVVYLGNLFKIISDHHAMNFIFSIKKARILNLINNYVCKRARIRLNIELSKEWYCRGHFHDAEKPYFAWQTLNYPSTLVPLTLVSSREVQVKKFMSKQAALICWVIFLPTHLFEQHNYLAQQSTFIF